MILVDSDADAADDIGQPYKYGDVLKTAAKDGNTYKLNVVYRGENGVANDGDDLDLVVVDVTGAFDFNKPEAVTPPTGDNSGSATDGNFTFTTTDARFLKVNKAIVQADGSVLFSVAGAGKVVGNTFKWTVSVNGVPAEADDVTIALNDLSYVTAKIKAKDSDKITIALSDIDINKLGSDATAENVNDALKQEGAEVTLDKVPAGKINVPKDAKLTIGNGTDAVTIEGNTTIAGEGALEVKSDTTISGNVDMSAVKPTVDSGKAITVADGGSLKVDANTDGNLPAGKVEIAAGGSLTSMTTNSDAPAPTTFVGPTADARIQTGTETSVAVEFSANHSASSRHKMTITGDATIPEGKTWFAMFDSASNAQGIDMVVTGKLTVNGTLKLASANQTGSSLTATGSASVVVGANGKLVVGGLASLTGADNNITGTSAASALQVFKAVSGGTISGANGVENRDADANYTWDAAETKWVAKT